MKNNDLKLKSYQVAMDNFKAKISASNYKNSTNYTTPVAEFFQWLEHNGIAKLGKVSIDDMKAYIQYLTDRPNKRLGGTLSESSLKGHYLALNLMFEMMLDSGAIQKAFTLPTFKRTDLPCREILTVEEVKELKRSCQNPLETAIINIGYGCGLRRTEMQNLNVQDVVLSKGYLIVRCGKKGNRREVPIPDGILNELKEYLIQYRPQLLENNMRQEKAFFANRKGLRMSGDLLNDVLKIIIQRTDNAEIISKNITLHCLRHSIATHLQEAKAGIEFIKTFLGHIEIDTTLIYMVRRKKQYKIR